MQKHIIKRTAKNMEQIYNVHKLVGFCEGAGLGPGCGKCLKV